MLLDLGVSDIFSSGPGMARRIYSLSSCWGHQNGVELGCRVQQNGVNFCCQGHCNGAKFGFQGHLNRENFNPKKYKLNFSGVFEVKK